MAEVFKKLTDREHILQRSGMYLGSIQESSVIRFINGEQKALSIVPGLLKISNELLDNSIDEHIRSDFKYATHIDITMNSYSLTIEDDGRGIPIEQYQGEWRPQVAWCEAKAGTSFSENRLGPGANGVGSVIANVFSKQFIGETYDGKQYCKCTCSDNMQYIKTTVMKSKKRGTRVYIEPDFERFGVKEYSQDHIQLFKERVIALACTYNIAFTFNNEKIILKKPENYLKMYGDIFVPFIADNIILGIFPSKQDEYVHHTVIDGLDMVLGGTHESYFSRELCYSLRDLIKKKHKLDMTPAEIKRGIKLILVGRFFPNMEFESQTKEKLTNAEKDVKQWFGPIDFDKLSKKIIGIPEIIDPIIEAKLAKQIAADNRAVALAQKKIAKKNVDKHVPALSKKIDETILFLSEGDSVASSARKIRNPQCHGLFPLRGMPMNTYNESQKKILENKELSNIMSILGLKFGMSDTQVLSEIQYGKVGILCDGDLDGIGGIAPLLLNFFWNWKILFAKSKICIINSPRYICTKGKGKKKEIKYFYDTTDFNMNRDKYKGWEIRYIKGLGSLRDEEMQYVLDHSENWSTVEVDNPECFKIMFSENVDDRKKLMGE